jgi:hypothetical protein
LHLAELGEAKRYGKCGEHECKATAHNPGSHGNSKSLVPVSDSASSQVVRREFQRHAIAIHDFDAIAAQSTRHGG